MISAVHCITPIAPGLQDPGFELFKFQRLQACPRWQWQDGPQAHCHVCTCTQCAGNRGVRVLRAVFIWLIWPSVNAKGILLLL